MNNLKSGLMFAVSLWLIANTGAVFGAESTTIYEQCYINKIKNAKVGYSCTIRQEKSDDTKKLFITNKYSEQEFKRFGFTIRIVADLQFVEDEDGNPVTFSAKVESLGEDVDLKGKFTSPGVVTLTSNIGGIQKTEQLKIDKKILFPYAIEKLFRDNKDAENIEYNTVDPTTGFKIINIKAQKVATESLPADELNGTYNKYKVTMGLLPNISNYEWYDDSGKLIKELSSILDIEHVAVNKDKIYSKNENFDILSSSFIPIDVRIDNPSIQDDISYKITVRNTDPDGIFVNDERQRVIQIKDNNVFLKVKNEKIKETFKYPVNNKGHLKYLLSGPFIVSDNTKIIRLAKNIVGQDTDAYSIAKKMEKWVYNNIKNKNFSTNFANSVDVLNSRTGDCTEHSVLLAALLRAAGIPSQVVVGLIYTEVPEKSFGYHMWVKAYVGKWINLDPSFPSSGFSPVHIAIYESPLNSLSDRTDAVLNIIKGFSNLKIEVLNTFSSNSGISNIRLSNNTVEGKGLNDVSIKNENDNDNYSPVKQISLAKPDLSSIVKIDTTPPKSSDYVRSGIYNFTSRNIPQAKEDFMTASKMITFNDDYSLVKLAKQSASFGFFNFAEKLLSKVRDLEIWEPHINSIKDIYFPAQNFTEYVEDKLAKSLSVINFNPKINYVVETINKIEQDDTCKDNDYAHFLLARAYGNRKLDHKKALSEYEKAVKLNPDNLNYRLERAKLYNKLGYLQKAKNDLDYLNRKKIADVNFAREIELELCINNFKAESKNPIMSQYYNAKFYATKGDYQVAIDILNKITVNKNVPECVYNLLGHMYFITNQADKAKLTYKKMIELNPKNDEAYLSLARINQKEGKYKDALEGFFKAAKIKPSVCAFLGIAGSYKYLSQEEESYKYFNKVLQMEPDNTIVRYDLGIMYSDMGRIDDAVSMFKRALSADPYDTKFWLELAKLEIKKKNYFLARSYLASFNSMSENNPEYYYNMGLIEKGCENFNSARENLKRAVELNPDFLEAKKLLDEI